VPAALPVPRGRSHPETPDKAQVRGIVVHAVLEKLFGLPAAERVPDRANELIGSAWADLVEERHELAELFDGPDDPELAGWLDGARGLLASYFELEDPRRLQPEACELRVETELESGLLLRGFIDRLDVAPTGEIRIVDYKTARRPGSSARPRRCSR